MDSVLINLNSSRLSSLISMKLGISKAAETIKNTMPVIMLKARLYLIFSDMNKDIKLSYLWSVPRNISISPMRVIPAISVVRYKQRI